MRQAERLETILEWLSGNGSVNVADISDELGVSAATVRRDLDFLERQRLLARTHGGAVAQGVLYELPLRYKGGRHKEEKLRIAREAATRVAAGHAVGLTGGTTTTEVARALVDHQRLTLVTNALNIASEMAVRPNLKLVVTGGVARSESYELVGPIAEASLAGLNLDIVFVGADNLVRGGGRDVRALIALTFGLVHGFGFANVLREFGLPREALGWSLFSFNVGVEIGQLFIVLLVATALALLRRWNATVGARVAFAGSLVVIAAGTYWFVQRVFFPTGI